MKKTFHEGRTRLRILGVAIGFSFGLVIIRLAALQGIEAPHWVRKAAREHERTFEVQGERGKIYDRNGQPLAVNVEVPSVFAVPSLISDPEATARKLASLFQEDRRLLLQRLKTGREFVWIHRKADPERVGAFSLNRTPGLGILMESQRVYPKQLLLGQTLGFADTDNRGLEGVELRYDAQLQGERGRLIFEQDARGLLVFPKNLAYHLPSGGKNIYLTVDERIQYVSERELDRAMESTRAKAGLVITMDPRTGELLSLAVRPQFNPNARDSHLPSQWRNRPITDLYEPGSTFKIVAAAAALEEGAVRPDELIFCENGRMNLAGKTLHDHTPSLWLSFEDVVAKSSNIGIAKVAARLGPDRLMRYISGFGFGEKTGIDLPGEAQGKIRALSEWSERSLATIAIGQEVGVTPIQMISAMAAIANGGLLLTPHVMRLIADEQGQGIYSASPQVRRRVVSEETARKLTRILERVVERGGTGERAAIPGYPVAGKTGTAQKFDPVTGTYSADRFVSSFVGFIPADFPKVVILVLIDEPQGANKFGGSVAAPVFRSIGEEVLQQLGAPPRGRSPVVFARAALGSP